MEKKRKYLIILKLDKRNENEFSLISNKSQI